MVILFGMMTCTSQKKAVIGEESFKRIWTTSDAVYYPLVFTTFWV
jgi:hypothetical protein